MTETTEPLRLRSAGPDRPFQLVLVEPEIPPNTGAIARLCGATRTPLHLVGKLGFSIDEHAVRRAGVDYWHLVEVHHHPDYATAVAAIRSGNSEARFWLYSGHAVQSCFDVVPRPGDALVFGKESVGLPLEMLRAEPGQVVGIPTLGGVRSLNLANAASIALYEALRQVGGLTIDPARSPTGSPGQSLADCEPSLAK